MSVTVSVDGDIAHVVISNPPVNAASHAVRQGLVDAVATVEAEEGVRAVVLSCAGSTFTAGADIREFGKPPVEPHLPDVVLVLERATKPWVAAIHGTALGGGLEIALGCAYRIADKNARLGFPEVNIGLIPGAGGTVRLPRLVSAEDALAMISGGKPVSAEDALKMGLVDEITSGDLLADATAYARRAADAPIPEPLSQRPPNQPKDAADWQTRLDAVRKKARGQHSPVAATEALDFALKSDAETALASERDTFTALKEHPQSKALRHIFFAERATGKIPLVKDVSPRPLDSIGIVGGGTMGSGIAAACLLAGFPVTMVERDADALAAGRDRVTGILDGSLARGLITKDRHHALRAALTGATDHAALSGADLVVEAVFEDMDVKRDVMAAIDAATKPAAVLATNTSYLDIDRIAEVVADPSRVIGLHFFSPAHIMKLLELVIPDVAAPDVVATGFALGKRLRKITVPAGVCDGFIGNRIMSRYRALADEMLEDGALPYQIDAAMRDFGFPMGIFEMQDLAGLDIAWAMRKRRAAHRDPSARYVEIADKLCEAGRFGRKTGCGWYLYDGKTAERDPEVEDLIIAESARRGIARRDFTTDDIMENILSTMQSEGRAILAEGIAQGADDIDVVMVNGYSFPRWRGGPMFMADAH